jgi:hypothetical protein
MELLTLHPKEVIMEEYVRQLYFEEYLTIQEIAMTTNLSIPHVRHILGYPPEV